MRRTHLRALCLGGLVLAIACGGKIDASACQTGAVFDGIALPSKLCPNDPTPLPQDVESCSLVSRRMETCAKECAAYASCIVAHYSDVCGADGRTDDGNGHMKAVRLINDTCHLGWPDNYPCVYCMQTH